MKENSNQPQVAMTIEVLAVAVETVIGAVAVVVAEVEIVEETAVLVVR